MEDPAFDGTALEHVSLGRLELVEAGREQRLDRRRHARRLARFDSRTSASISSTNSGLPSAAVADPLAQPLVDSAESVEKSVCFLA